AKVPREHFVPTALRPHAYHDVALPIGQGQTISQPRIVAQMTEALSLDRPSLKVLEIGTGSGYQTAILAQLVDRIFTIERHPNLLREALLRLEACLLPNPPAIFSQAGDGSHGWSSMAPFHRIIVTAAAMGEVPKPLLAQLAVKGVMVIPLASKNRHEPQRLLRITRPDASPHFQQEELGLVQFVPLVASS
ncbi:MAG: protein-L-isoaspartate(D-aspartate) O-methyltransferase, partial [Alphaproteobacteria bacterium]|nr:protein-L-isoaspartate(D-aspartate) O-methyltransferase [Alphaproteobacteria bacterium]